MFFRALLKSLNIDILLCSVSKLNENNNLFIIIFHW